jgi:hypothetical protein
MDRPQAGSYNLVRCTCRSALARDGADARQSIHPSLRKLYAVRKRARQRNLRDFRKPAASEFGTRYPPVGPFARCMKPVSKTFLALILTLPLIPLTGCVAVVAGAAGAGAVAWVSGELNATLDASFERTEDATNKAIVQLQFAKISERFDALTDNFVVRTADDKKITIKVTKLTASSSKVQIRVGVFGDEPVSLTVLEKIKANL